MDIFSITDLISFVAGSSIEKDSQEISTLVGKLSALSEDELKSSCVRRKLYEFGQAPHREIGIHRFLRNLFPFFFRTMNPVIKEGLAIGIAAFARCPADLENTELFPTQIKAAIALTNSCIIQMDTGEGKTYALLPAAFAYVCLYGRVYIVCANDYLARRDANRTKSYWDYVGVDVQCAERGINHTSTEWGGEVIYTTLNTLLFKVLADDLHGCPLERRIRYHAIILDEVDAVLLDNPSPRSTVQEIRAETYDWDRSIEFARTLDPAYDVVVDGIDLTATLTIEGEDRLREYLIDNRLPLSALYQMRVAVEYAYIALHVAENRDYVIQDHRIYSINRLTGELERHITPNWMTPLAILKKLPPPNHSITLHSISPAMFIQQFEVVSGMSGTAKDSATEYMMFYQLPTIIIKPRRKRWKGELPDAVFPTQNGAISFLCDEIIDAVQSGRPVLAGTQSISEAERLYKALILRQDLDASCVHLITGRDDAQVASIYEHAGELGSVIVATQIAGRGVDIRLNEEVRQNGGLALLGLERSPSRRHDRQFLGRAGRQGDPYTAQFVITFEGQLIRENIDDKTLGVMNSTYDAFDIEDSIPMQNKALNASITNLQTLLRQREFRNQSAAHFLLDAEAAIYHSVKCWLQSLNATNKAQLSETFLNYLCNHFIDANLSSSIKRSMDYQQAQELINIITHLLPNMDTRSLHAMILDGKSREAVARTIKAQLKQQIMAREKGYANQLRRIQSTAFFLSEGRISRLRGRASRIVNDMKTCQWENVPADITLTKLLSAAAWVHENSMITSRKLKHLYNLLNYLEQNKTKVWSNSQWRRLDSVLCTLAGERFWKHNRYVILAQYQKLRQRSGYAVSFWTIVGAEIRYRNYYNQMTHIYNNQEPNIFIRNQLIMDSATEEWAKIENTLSTEMINNLTSDRLLLDNLFTYYDNAVSRKPSKVHGTSGKSIASAKSADENGRRADARDWNRILVSEFINQTNLRSFGPSFNRQSLEALLLDFLQLCPPSTLQSPSKIELALEQWRRQEILREITSERTKLNHKWILKFLRYMNKKGVISPLPSFLHRLHSVVGKAIHSLRDFNGLFTFACLISFCGLFAASSLLLQWSPLTSVPFTSFFLVDTLLFAGFIAKGMVTAPMIPLARFFVGWEARLRLGIITVFLFFYINLLDPVRGFLPLLARVPMCVAFAVLYHVLCNLYTPLYLSTDIPLFSAWIVFSVSTAFLPVLWSYSTRCVIVLGLVMLCDLTLHKYISKQSVSFLSTQIVSSAVALKSVQHRIQRKVSGYVSTASHIYAFIGSFLLHTCLKYLPMPYQKISYYAAILFYLAVLFLLDREVIWNRFSLNVWRENLHKNRLMIIDSSAEEPVDLDLEQVLATLRHRFLIREILFQLAALGTCGFLLAENQAGETYPLFLIVLSVSYWFGEHLSRLCSFIYQFFSRNGHMVEKTIDFEHIQEPEDDKTFSQKITDLLNPFTSYKKAVTTIFAILGILAALNERFGFLSGAFEQIINLFAR